MLGLNIPIWDLEKLRRVLVPVPRAAGMGGGMEAETASMAGGMSASSAPSGGGMGARAPLQIPLGQFGRLEAAMGPPMIKSEAGSLTAWVYVDVIGRDIGGYVDVAKAAVALWGGLVSLTILTLGGIPVLYVIWRGFPLRHQLKASEAS